MYVSLVAVLLLFNVYCIIHDHGKLSSYISIFKIHGNCNAHHNVTSYQHTPMNTDSISLLIIIDLMKYKIFVISVWQELYHPPCCCSPSTRSLNIRPDIHHERGRGISQDTEEKLSSPPNNIRFLSHF